MTTLHILSRQVRLDQRAFWRSLQSAFFTLVLPISLLLVLGSLNADVRLDGERFTDRLLPGLLVFGVIGASYVNLASTIAVLRSEGILKRLQALPVPRWVFLASQLVSALISTAFVVAATYLTGFIVFRAQLHTDHLAGALVGLVVGVACFCALGLALASFIRRADAVTPVVNATWLPLAIVSGVFYPMAHIPGWLERGVSAFPMRPLVETFQPAFVSDPNMGRFWSHLLVLAAWAVGGVLITARWFRWSPP
jgi:ABC-2 type transport system permease protein